MTTNQRNLERLRRIRVARIAARGEDPEGQVACPLCSRPTPRHGFPSEEIGRYGRCIPCAQARVPRIRRKEPRSEFPCRLCGTRKALRQFVDRRTGARGDICQKCRKYVLGDETATTDHSKVAAIEESMRVLRAAWLRERRESVPGPSDEKLLREDAADEDVEPVQVALEGQRGAAGQAEGGDEAPGTTHRVGVHGRGHRRDGGEVARGGEGE